MLDEEQRLERLIDSAQDDERLEAAYEEAEALFEWFRQWWKLPRHLRTDWSATLHHGSLVCEAMPEMERFALMVKDA